MSDPTDRQYREQHGAEDRFGSSTDIVQEQTRHRLRAENATWRQQQASAARMRRAEWICFAFVIIGGLIVLGIELVRAWRLN